MEEGSPLLKSGGELYELCLCSTDLHMVELVSDEIGGFIEEISKQSVEEEFGFSWLITEKC